MSIQREKNVIVWNPLYTPAWATWVAAKNNSKSSGEAYRVRVIQTRFKEFAFAHVPESLHEWLRMEAHRIVIRVSTIHQCSAFLAFLQITHYFDCTNPAKPNDRYIHPYAIVDVITLGGDGRIPVQLRYVSHLCASAYFVRDGFIIYFKPFLMWE